MGLYYPSVHHRPIIGTRVGTTRTPVTLASTYGAVSGIISTGGYSKLNLDVLYTMGATETTNTVELKLEGSPDGTNFYRIPNEAAALGVSTLYAREFTFTGTDAAAATISIGIDVFYKHLKVSAKESGVVTNAGTIYVEYTLNGK